MNVLFMILRGIHILKQLEYSSESIHTYEQFNVIIYKLLFIVFVKCERGLASPNLITFQKQ